MAEKTIDLRAAIIRALKLPAKATDEQIIAAVELAEKYEEREQRIALKIAESGGALSRDMAIMTLREQDAEDARNAKAEAEAKAKKK